MKLIDSHTHVNFSHFDKDRPEVIKRSFDNETYMINVGIDLETSVEAVKLAEQYRGKMWATIGIHPNDAPKNIFPEGQFLSLAEKDDVVGIGETGLDFYRTKDKEAQKIQFEFFEKHIDLADKVQKPLVVHIREAYQEAAKFLKNRLPNKGGIIHCFTGSFEEVKLFLDLGFFVSFTGIITFSNTLAEVVKKTPLDKMLVETDAPYLAPVPHRGSRNEPVWVELVAQKVAEIKDLPFNEIYQQTLINTQKLFKLSLNEKV